MLEWDKNMPVLGFEMKNFLTRFVGHIQTIHGRKIVYPAFNVICQTLLFNTRIYDIICHSTLCHIFGPNAMTRALNKNEGMPRSSAVDGGHFGTKCVVVGCLLRSWPCVDWIRVFNLDQPVRVNQMKLFPCGWKSCTTTKSWLTFFFYMTPALVRPLTSQGRLAPRIDGTKIHTHTHTTRSALTLHQYIKSTGRLTFPHTQLTFLTGGAIRYRLYHIIPYVVWCTAV